MSLSVIAQVDGLPGYVLEPVSKEVRELNVQSSESGANGDSADGDGMSDEELVHPFPTMNPNF
jgi:hypothetical protein